MVRVLYRNFCLGGKFRQWKGLKNQYIVNRIICENCYFLEICD